MTTGFRLKKTIRVKVNATLKEVKIKYPKQSLGNVWLTAESGKIMASWNLVMVGGKLKVEQISEVL